jgi:DNA-binding response OmpR family regulator
VAQILLVDDEALVRKVVRVVLEAEGHVVTEAADGPAALGCVADSTPDVVVLDLMIPGMDGFEVCRQIKAGAKPPYVLVLTSVPQGEADDAAREAGADDVMTKPFSALELLDRISKLVGA